MLKSALLLAVTVLFLGCNSPKWIKNQNSGGALGTSYSIIYISKEPLDYQKEIDSVFQVMNQSMSTYIPTSDISKINEGDSTVVVDDMFKEVFDISTEVHRASNGYFDPTIGVLANAWGFGPGEQMQLDSLKVDSLLRYVGWDKVQLNSDNTITKTNPAIRFDFNAVAKGYAIDRLGALLDAKGIENYLVEVGGEVLAKGTNMSIPLILRPDIQKMPMFWPPVWWQTPVPWLMLLPQRLWRWIWLNPKRYWKTMGNWRPTSSTWMKMGRLKSFLLLVLKL